MTVKKIRDLAAKARVYELRPDAKYLIILNDNIVSDAAAYHLCSALQAAGIDVVTIATENGGGVRLVELKP